MKTVELTKREQLISMCLVRMEENTRQQENWKMDMKNERFTDAEIERYDTNSAVLLELSAIVDKLKD